MLVNARIVEIKLPVFIHLFQGKYNDFSVEWYRVVGSTISFTMFINIFTPHIGSIVGFVIGSFKRCLDRGCSLDSKKTKQWIQEDYEKMYTGPEFLIEIRYSQLLASFYILMCYSSGMPLLYIISMLQYFFTYWVDKFMFLRLYKTPPRYGIEMSETTRKIMVLGILLHFALGFYMYSNSQIFTYSTTTFQQLDTLRSQIEVNAGDYLAKAEAGSYLNSKRMLQTHALIYIAGIVLFIVINILALVTVSLCRSTCAGFCCCCFLMKKGSGK